MKIIPPKRPLQFLRWFCREDYLEEIEGDLTEVFIKQSESSPRNAKWKFAWSVVKYFRPEFMKSFTNLQPNSYGMYKSYFKIGWRNLLKNKGYSLINIGGLALGMAVTLLIGLWMHDELTFDSYHPNHDRIAHVMNHLVSNGQISTGESNPVALADAIRNTYGTDFKYVLNSLWTDLHTLTYGDKMLSQMGNYFEPQVTDMLGLKMIHGSNEGLKNMNAILLSASVAKLYFGEDDPIGKWMRVDDRHDVQVAGVYEDIPDNSSFKDLKFILSWELWLSRQQPSIREMKAPWDAYITQTYAQIADHADMQNVSAKISKVMLNNTSENGKIYKPVVFLHPMNKWHLYSDFKNGINTGGRIDNVWLFGIIGVFVLLLACINFMNLSTARSEKRSKEVGIRKSIGSARGQLIVQFFSESVMVAVFAFFLALIIVALILPAFDEIADKKIAIPWSHPMLWLIGIGFSVVTGLLAGLYPALFLSSFNPVKVLKGTFRLGRLASLPRKALVVVQFTVSITLIIGTMVIYKQVKHAQNRAIGYSRDGLISVNLNRERKEHFEVIRAELKNERAIIEMTQSGSPITDSWVTQDRFDWEGKDPNQAVDFPTNAVSYEYGKTIGWEVKAGRDFSREFTSDSSTFILNEAAVKFIGLKDPIGKIIRWRDKPYTIIGVVKDLLMQSPYSPVQPHVFYLSQNNINLAIVRVNPELNVQDALGKIEAVFKKYNPASPFYVNFADDEFARKFSNEERMGTLAALFAMLAVIISCLGLFGLASFVAEQRTKELGIRKVLGASVANLWRMLSTDFVILVLISCLISIPVSHYFLSDWLKNYEYRTEISWWIFALSCFGALIMTFLTVSFQAIKAAVMNPVKSLRSE